jgi:hypothetical protein
MIASWGFISVFLSSFLDLSFQDTLERKKEILKNELQNSTSG